MSLCYDFCEIWKKYTQNWMLFLSVWFSNLFKCEDAIFHLHFRIKLRLGRNIALRHFSEVLNSMCCKFRVQFPIVWWNVHLCMFRWPCFFNVHRDFFFRVVVKKNYTTIYNQNRENIDFKHIFVAIRTGLEPVAPSLGNLCSIQMS